MILETASLPLASVSDVTRCPAISVAGTLRPAQADAKAEARTQRESHAAAHRKPGRS